MSDCTNIDVREQLPDLLSGRLTAADRRAVEAHVASCADCAAELQLLRDVRQLLGTRQAPVMDTAAIVAALPRPVVAPTRSRLPVNAWRMAAAITLMAIGGMSLSSVRKYFGASPGSDTTAVADPLPQVAVQPEVSAAQPETIAVSSATPQVPARVASLTAGGGVSDLADEDLEALIGALERLEAAPGAEPDANPLTRIISGTGGN